MDKKQFASAFLHFRGSNWEKINLAKSNYQSSTDALIATQTSSDIHTLHTYLEELPTSMVLFQGKLFGLNTRQLFSLSDFTQGLRSHSPKLANIPALSINATFDALCKYVCQHGVFLLRRILASPCDAYLLARDYYFSDMHKPVPENYRAIFNLEVGGFRLIDQTAYISFVAFPSPFKDLVITRSSLDSLYAAHKVAAPSRHIERLLFSNMQIILSHFPVNSIQAAHFQYHLSLSPIQYYPKAVSCEDIAGTIQYKCEYNASRESRIPIPILLQSKQSSIPPYDFLYGLTKGRYASLTNLAILLASCFIANQPCKKVFIINPLAANSLVALVKSIYPYPLEEFNSNDISDFYSVDCLDNFLRCKLGGCPAIMVSDPKMPSKHISKQGRGFLAKIFNGNTVSTKDSILGQKHYQSSIPIIICMDNDLSIDSISKLASVCHLKVSPVENPILTREHLLWLKTTFLFWGQSMILHPRTIQDSPTNIQTHDSIFALFLKSFCIQKAGAETSGKEMYDCYCKLCVSSSVVPIPYKTFFWKMKNIPGQAVFRPHHQKNGPNCYAFRDLALPDDPEGILSSFDRDTSSIDLFHKWIDQLTSQLAATTQHLTNFH